MKGLDAHFETMRMRYEASLDEAEQRDLTVEELCFIQACDFLADAEYVEDFLLNDKDDGDHPLSDARCIWLRALKFAEFKK
jgi:hypothetical protein